MSVLVANLASIKLFSYLIVWQALQKGEEERVAKYGVLLSQYSEVHAKVIPIINKCLEGMKNAAKFVDGPKVSYIIPQL